MWQEVPVPVIAAVHGHALGGGLQIALGADIRFCAPDAQLSVREVHWGLVPDMTGTFVLSRLVRPDIAKELVFTAKVVSGDRGARARAGHPPHAEPLRGRHGAGPRDRRPQPGCGAGIQGAAQPGAVRRRRHQFADERQVIGSLIGTPNQVEAVMANFEKRPAQFVD